MKKVEISIKMDKFGLIRWKITFQVKYSFSNIHDICQKYIRYTCSNKVTRKRKNLVVGCNLDGELPPIEYGDDFWLFILN